MVKKPMSYIPKGLDQQGRHPEAAHAASEIDEWKYDPWWWVTDLVIAISLTAVVLFVIVLVGLIP